MKKVLISIGVLVTVALITLAFVNNGNSKTVQAKDIVKAEVKAVQAEGDIKWFSSWEEAVKAVEKTDKPLFVDCYTDWCGWCKRMDATTFKDDAVVDYMNNHFIALKFNAEQKEDIQWRGKTLKFVNAGRRGVHELAYSLLDGRLGYPSFVYLDENVDRITISPGFKKADQLLKELKYVAEGHYKSATFSEYENNN